MSCVEFPGAQLGLLMAPAVCLCILEAVLPPEKTMANFQVKVGYVILTRKRCSLPRLPRTKLCCTTGIHPGLSKQISAYNHVICS